MNVEIAENNARAVILSEELDFLEELIGLGTLDGDELRITLDRRDVVRDSLVTFRSADPNDHAEQGIPMPGEAGMRTFTAEEKAAENEEYDADDAVPFDAEDEDHDYQSNRNDTTCLVCHQPKDACKEEPDAA